jgi:hypothetical protein
MKGLNYMKALTNIIILITLVPGLAALPAMASSEAVDPAAVQEESRESLPGNAGENGPSAHGAARMGKREGWLPGTRLYRAMLADPRRTAFSGALRYDDDAFERYARTAAGVNSGVLGSDRLFGAISAGGRFPVYRWKLPEGSMQLGIEGGIWALFAMKSRDGGGDMSTMLNADYLVAFPTEFAWKDLSLQFRFYHVSSHVGDELMERCPGFRRINLSYEAVDLFLSYAVVPQVRLYAGLGCVVHYAQEGSFDPVMLHYGAEFFPFAFMRAGGLFWRPFIALHLGNRQFADWAFDGNYALGLEFVPRRVLVNTRFEISLAFRHGKSMEGQFYRARTSFLEAAFYFEL